MTDGEKMHRVSTVSKRLSCSVSYVYQLIEGGQLPVVKIGVKKGYRVKDSDLEKFVKTCQEQVPSEFL